MALKENEVINITIDEACLRDIISDCIDVSIRRDERFGDTCPDWDRDELANEYLKEIMDEALENSCRMAYGELLHINTVSSKLHALIRDCIDTSIHADKEMKAIGRGWSRTGLAVTYVNDLRTINKKKTV